jgi:signal transduction histidine kinase
MSHRARPPRRELDPVERERRRAVRTAWLKVVFAGHVVVWFSVVLMLAVVATPLVAVVVAAAWGVGVVAHGFVTVVAPALWARWVEAEVGRKVGASVTRERRNVEGRHARALESLSASVAHEIRNPVTAAKSLVQQIAEDPTSTTNAEYARVAAAELDRVERSVSHLLRYAREEPLTLTETDLEDVVRGALETLSARVGKTAVRVEARYEGATAVEGDADKLRRVVINLVGNAVDALVDSGFPDPTVEIVAGSNSDGEGRFLRVKDNGPGIEPERLPKIFDPFHTSKEQGTGLGLAITRKLVEAHGGAIEVESSFGQGATFTVTLPRRGPDA